MQRLKRPTKADPNRDSDNDPPGSFLLRPTNPTSMCPEDPKRELHGVRRGETRRGMSAVQVYSRSELLALRERESSVPCGSCSACCKKDVIVLDTGRGDDLSAYRWHEENGLPVLDRRPDGACIYLGAAGCSIYAERPSICRRFDCRVLFLLVPKERRRERVRENPTMAAVYEAGKRRLDTLRSQGSE